MPAGRRRFAFAGIELEDLVAGLAVLLVDCADAAPGRTRAVAQSATRCIFMVNSFCLGPKAEEFRLWRPAALPER